MKRKSIDKTQRALTSPVARAIARRELQVLQAHMTGVADQCLQAPHGSEQRDLIAGLALMIGIGAEVALHVPVLGDNRAGLHQALQEVVRMACDGCCWSAPWAAQLHLAMEVSAEVMMDDTIMAMRVLPGARGLAADILAGRVRPEDVAPLEMPIHYRNDSYQRLPAGAVGAGQ